MIAELEGTVTITQAARDLGLSPSGIRYHLRLGGLEAVPTPYGRLVVRESIEKFLRNRTQDANKTIARHK